MTTFLDFTVVGIAIGCIYALSATGLVVTYITSGIFNFAHAAIGMVAAFMYWDLTVRHHWNVLLALAVVILIAGPLIGALIDALVMRNLHGASEEVRVIVTVGLMLFILGVGQWIWKPNQAYSLPRFFPRDQVKILGVYITYHQLIVIFVAIAVALSLRLFLFRTKTGVSLRAVVDAPELAAYFGASPGKVRMLGWAIGSSLAALAGVLIASVVTMDHLLLTLLVLNVIAAAILGRLKSLPLTFVGGVLIGLLEAYVVGYAPGKILNQLHPTVPVIFAYVALLALPQVRLRVGRALARRSTKVASLRTSLIAGGLFVLASWIVASNLSV